MVKKPLFDIENKILTVQVFIVDNRTKIRTNFKCYPVFQLL